MADLRTRIRRLIAEACEDIRPEDVPESARMDDIPGWDSLAHIGVVERIAREFGREIPDEQIGDLRSVDGIVRWLQSNAEPDGRTDTSAEPGIDLESALRRAGLGAGDLVMVHSFTPALGGLERPDRRLIEALLSVIGPEGTLVLPAFTYSFCTSGVYRPDEDRSEVGIAADTLRIEYEGRRTNAPIFSVVAVGALSDEILSLSSRTTFGPDSIFGYLLRRGGTLCGVGVGFEKITFNHYPEEELAVPYRYWKRFSGVIEEGGERRPTSVRFFVRSLEPEAVRDQSKIVALMGGARFVGRAKVGGCEVTCAPAEQYYLTLSDAMRADPLFQLSDESRKHWE
jgi:aminoglycoside 3-N-acetyltransferase